MKMKMTRIIAALVCAAAPLSASPAFADDAVAAPAAKAAFTTTDTDLGTLLDNPATKAVLEKYIPEMVASPRIEMARGMTLKQVQGFAPDKLTDEALAKIDADLSKVPAPK